MSKSANTNALRITVIALYALAMTVVSMARHDVDVGTSAVATDALAYALPGSGTAVLCQHGGAGTRDLPGNGAPTGDGCCDACVMSHAPGIGGVAWVDFAHPPIRRAAPDARQAPDLIAVWRAEPMSRGPPAA